MNLLKVILFACLIAWVSGCKVGPDYVRPVVESPYKWRDQDTATASIADISYLQFYDDNVLQGLISEGLDSNYDIAMAQARIDEAIAGVTITKSELFPTVGADGSAGGIKASPNRFPSLPTEVTDGVQSVFSLSGLLNWELDVWGRIRRNVEGQRAVLASNIEVLRAQKISLAAAIAEAYVTLREHDRLLEILDSNIATRQEYEKLAYTLFTGGKTSELDYRQAEAELNRVRAARPSLFTQVAKLENTISILLGRPPGIPIPRGIALQNLAIPGTIPGGIPSTLVERRPDILATEYDLIAQNASIGSSIADMFPKFAITADVGLQSTDLSNLINGNSLALNAAGNIAQPIFNAGRLSARVDAAEARTVSAEARYRQVILNAFKDVNNSITEVNNSRAEVQYRVAAVSATFEVLRLSELRYRYGAAPYLQVLDAQRSLLDAQTAEANVRASQFRALINLYKALGGGWQ